MIRVEKTIGEMAARRLPAWRQRQAVLHSMATTCLLAWQAGVYVDVWYHVHCGFEIDSFLTWAHVLLYAGWAAAGLVVVVYQLLSRARPPRGYRTYLLGVALFGLGGGADFAWHSLFGFEAGHDAILSAAHLLLAVAFTVAAFGLLESVTCWRARAGEAGPTLRLVDLPLVLCLGMLLRVTFWYLTYALPLTFDFATGGATARGLPAFQDVAANGQVAQIAGSAGIMLHGVILALFLVVSLRYLSLPGGSIALIMLYDALLIVPATDQWLALPAVTGAALVGEGVWSWMQRGGLGGIDGEAGYWVLGAVVPLGERRHHLPGLQREQVQAQFERLFEVDQRLEPAWTYGARVASHGERAGVLVVEADVVAGDFEDGRRDEVGERAGAEGEAPLVGAEPVLTCSIASDLQERHQELLPLVCPAWTTRAVYSARSRRRRCTRESSGHQQA
jgi:hypothetical protein